MLPFSCSHLHCASHLSDAMCAYGTAHLYGRRLHYMDMDMLSIGSIDIRVSVRTTLVQGKTPDFHQTDEED